MKWTILTFATVILSCNLVSCTDFDYFVFTQEWPFTFCMSKHCNYPTDIVTGWNIHGLWPNLNHGRSPERCQDGSPFDPHKIAPILDDLKNCWANLKAYNDPVEFWSYEWKTHGRCALSDNTTSSEFKYFSAALTLKKSLTLEKRLASQQIVPGDKQYRTSDIYNALKAAYGVDGEVRCASKDGQAYLAEIRMCFDKNLNKMDCPVDYYVREFLLRLGTNHCPSDGVIIPDESYALKKKMTMTIV